MTDRVPETFGSFLKWEKCARVFVALIKLGKNCAKEVLLIYIYLALMTFFGYPKIRFQLPDPLLYKPLLTQVKFFFPDQTLKLYLRFLLSLFLTLYTVP